MLPDRRDSTEVDDWVSWVDEVFSMVPVILVADTEYLEVYIRDLVMVMGLEFGRHFRAPCCHEMRFESVNGSVSRRFPHHYFDQVKFR